jgi:hypothetical protein
MTTQTLPLPSGERARKAAVALGIACTMVLGVVKARSAPALRNAREHGYTLGGFGCISAASFLHSTFTGLIVTGVLFLIFEWKVGD